MGARVDDHQTYAEIMRLDRAASLLGNRSQIGAKTRTRINSLMGESARLSRGHPDAVAANTRRTARTDTDRARFARGHHIYRRTQAPALTAARQSLRALLPCALPPPLERTVTGLIADLDRHASDMSEFSPSHGLPDGILRLLPPA